LILIFFRRPLTMCIPSMKLLALDDVAQISQQWVTPELGLNSTRVNGFLSRLRLHSQQEGFHYMLQLKITYYNLSFPTFPSQPRKCAPSLLNSPSTASLPFQGFSNRMDMKSQSSVVVVGIP
jgi:hypothetical protein